ncbi:protein of unknown function [Cupriavidus taiwanensis]|nr:protein of unknown function [Cupriavidus taiwanensis]
MPHARPHPRPSPAGGRGAQTAGVPKPSRPHGSAVYNAHPIAAAISGPERRTPSWNPRPPALPS